MSTTPDAATPPAGSLDLSRSAPVPLTRLVAVEARKSLDTLAGRWFTIAVLVLVVVVETIYALAAPDGSRGLGDLLGPAGGVLSYFLPILAIMLVTSEASQRTGLVTFTLEPRRSRVVVAKLAAGLLLSVAVIVLAFVIAVVAALLVAAGGGEVSWTVDASAVLLSFLLPNVVGVLIGFALATLLLNTPAAIVGYFVYSLVLPAALLILAALAPALADVVPWLHPSIALAPLFDPGHALTGEEWARIVVALVLWIAIPLTIGVRRLLRVEFK